MIEEGENARHLVTGSKSMIKRMSRRNQSKHCQGLYSSRVSYSGAATGFCLLSPPSQPATWKSTGLAGSNISQQRRGWSGVQFTSSSCLTSPQFRAGLIHPVKFCIPFCGRSSKDISDLPWETCWRDYSTTGGVLNAACSPL